MASVQEKIHQQFSRFPKRSYPKGQILVFADEQPEHIFYIVSGTIRQYDISYRGDDVIVNIFKAPAFFPMSWAINQSPNHFFYKAESDTEVHLVPVGEALNFLKSEPDVMFDLLSRLYRGMDGLLGRVVHLMSGTAKSRLMYELLIEARRFGQAHADGGVKLKINESDLAARAGMSRETISRELRKLKAKNWVEVDNNGIHITNVSALEKALGGEI